MSDPIQVDIVSGRIGHRAALVPGDADGTSPIVGRMLKGRRQLDGCYFGIVRFAGSRHNGRQRGIDGMPGEVHGMAAHITQLAATEVPVHIPAQAIHARTAGEVAGVVGVHGRGPDPEIVVQRCGWLALCRQVSGLSQLAVAPDKCR